MKKILSLILASLMLCLVLIGCDEKPSKTSLGDTGIDESYTALEARVDALEEKTDIDKTILANIEGIPMNEAAVRFAVLSAFDSFEDDEEREKEINDFFLLNAAIVKEAARLGVELDDDSFKQNVEAMQAYYKQYYGDEYEAAIADTPFTPNFLYLNQCYNVLFSNIFAKYTEDEGSELAQAVKNEAFEEAKEVLELGDYIRAKHILIQFPEDAEKDEDGNVAEGAKADTLAKANEVLAEVQAMSDPSEFDALIEKYGQDPGMESYPAGYYFTKNEMVAPFEEAAYALEEYGISGLVETPYGYHIIQRLPYDAEDCLRSSITSNQSFSEIYNNIAVEKTRTILFDYAKDYDVVYADEYKAAYDKYAKEYEEVWKPIRDAEKAAQAEEAAE